MASRTHRAGSGAASLGLALNFMCVAPAVGQRFPAGVAAPADWSIRGLEQIRFGRVSLVRDPAGARLDVYTLRAAVPVRSAHAPVSAVPPVDGDVLAVADFADEVRNRLGGFANVFERAPSGGTVEPEIGPDGRPGLRIACRHEPGGFCGGWVHLFDFTLPMAERRYLDASGLATLTFWVRGESGGEDVLLKVADAEWEQREDALPVSDVGALLPSGRIEPEWQLARVPLHELPARLDRETLAVLVFESRSTGESGVWITSVGFARSPDAAMPLPEPVRSTGSTRSLRRATWVWHTSELIGDADATADLIEFLREEAFDVAFLQLPDSSGGSRLPGEIVPDGAGLRPIVAALHAAGIDVYALDGYKRYALPEYHEGVLRTIDRVARYNANVRTGERFDGFRHDIEPYILPGFDGPRREPLLVQFLEIAARSAERAHGAGLRYGMDIPFWYDAPDPDTGEPVSIPFRGRVRVASEHVLDIADDIAIMDYRTSAFGADGTIRHAQDEVAYAERVGKSVFVGLETAPLLDEELIEFAGEGVRDPVVLNAPDGHIVIGDVGSDSARIVFVAPDVFAAHEGVPLEALRRSGIEPERALWWPVRSRTAVPSTRLSFAKRGEAELRHVTEQTVRGLSGSPAFAGFAIHEARTYRTLTGR